MKRMGKFKLMFPILFLLFLSVGCASATVMKVFGDSYSSTDVYNNVPMSSKSPYLVASEMNYTISNLAVSGASIEEQVATNIRSCNPNASDIIYFQTGPNDIKGYNTNIDGLETYNESLCSLLAWLAIPAENKTTGSMMEATGTWQAMLAYGGTGRMTEYPGRSLKKNVYGDTAYVAYVKNNATGIRKLDVYIDGIKTTLSCTGGVNSRLGTSYHPVLFRKTGLSIGVHNITIVVNSTTNATTYVDWVAGFDSTTLAPNHVYLINCPPFTDAYIDSININPLSFRYLNRRVLSTVETLNADGLDINLTNVYTGYNAATMMGADGLHPNVAGHQYIANTSLNTINGCTPNYVSSSIAGNAPLTVHFSDESITPPSLFAWDFNNDGIIDSNKTSPVYTYTRAGNYSVNLTVTNEYGNFSTVKTDYITITAQQPPSTLSELYWWLVGYLGLSVSYQAVVS